MSPFSKKDKTKRSAEETEDVKLRKNAKTLAEKQKKSSTSKTVFGLVKSKRKAIKLNFKKKFFKKKKVTEKKEEIISYTTLQKLKAEYKPPELNIKTHKLLESNTALLFETIRFFQIQKGFL